MAGEKKKKFCGAGVGALPGPLSVVRSRSGVAAVPGAAVAPEP